MASASGEFIKPLSGRGRVVVTATRSGQEQNATRFPEHFIAALASREADADQNGRVSVLEAFDYASRLTAEQYKRAGRLATEHALLDDSGDGVGHPSAEGGDGALARNDLPRLALGRAGGGQRRDGASAARARAARSGGRAAQGAQESAGRGRVRGRA